jgi:hypothetical protein
LKADKSLLLQQSRLFETAEPKRGPLLEGVLPQLASFLRQIERSLMSSPSTSVAVDSAAESAEVERFLSNRRYFLAALRLVRTLVAGSTAHGLQLLENEDAASIVPLCLRAVEAANASRIRPLRTATPTSVVPPTPNCGPPSESTSNGGGDASSARQKLRDDAALLGRVAAAKAALSRAEQERAATSRLAASADAAAASATSASKTAVCVSCGKIVEIDAPRAMYVLPHDLIAECNITRYVF